MALFFLSFLVFTRYREKVKTILTEERADGFVNKLALEAKYGDQYWSLLFGDPERISLYKAEAEEAVNNLRRWFKLSVFFLLLLLVNLIYAYFN